MSKKFFYPLEEEVYLDSLIQDKGSFGLHIQHYRVAKIYAPATGNILLKKQERYGQRGIHSMKIIHEFGPPVVSTLMPLKLWINERDREEFRTGGLVKAGQFIGVSIMHEGETIFDTDGNLVVNRPHAATLSWMMVKQHKKEPVPGRPLSEFVDPQDWVKDEDVKAVFPTPIKIPVNQLEAGLLAAEKAGPSKVPLFIGAGALAYLISKGRL